MEIVSITQRRANAARDNSEWKRLTSSGTCDLSKSDTWKTSWPASSLYGPPTPPRPAVFIPPLPQTHHSGSSDCISTDAVMFPFRSAHLTCMQRCDWCHKDMLRRVHANTTVTSIHTAQQCIRACQSLANLILSITFWHSVSLVTNCVPGKLWLFKWIPVCRYKSIITSKYTVHHYFSTSSRYTIRWVRLYDNVQNRSYIQSIL